MHHTRTLLRRAAALCSCALLAAAPVSSLPMFSSVLAEESVSAVSEKAAYNLTGYTISDPSLFLSMEIGTLPGASVCEGNGFAYEELSLYNEIDGGISHGYGIVDFRHTSRYAQIGSRIFEARCSYHTQREDGRFDCGWELVEHTADWSSETVWSSVTYTEASDTPDPRFFISGNDLFISWYDADLGWQSKSISLASGAETFSNRVRTYEAFGTDCLIYQNKNGSVCLQSADGSVSVLSVPSYQNLCLIQNSLYYLNSENGSLQSCNLSDKTFLSYRMLDTETSDLLSASLLSYNDNRLFLSSAGNDSTKILMFDPDALSYFTVLTLKEGTITDLHAFKSWLVFSVDLDRTITAFSDQDIFLTRSVTYAFDLNGGNLYLINFEDQTDALKIAFDEYEYYTTEAESTAAEPETVSETSAEETFPTDSTADTYIEPIPSDSATNAYSDPVPADSTADTYIEPTAAESSAETYIEPFTADSTSEAYTNPVPAESSAEAYTDPAIIESSAEAYTDPAISESSEAAYTDPAIAESSAEAYTDPAIAESSAEAYTDPAIAESSAEAYTDPAAVEFTTESYIEPTTEGFSEPASSEDFIDGADIISNLGDTCITINWEYTYTEYMSDQIPDNTPYTQIAVPYLGINGAETELTEQIEAEISSDANSVCANYLDAMNMPYCFFSYEPETSVHSRMDSSVISIVTFLDSYTGGAHGYYERRAFNYDTKTGAKITLAGLLADDSCYTAFAQSVCSRLDPAFSGTIVPDTVFNLLSSAERSADFSEFFFDTDGITVFFNPCEAGSSYADGFIVISIPYAELAGIVKSDYLTPDTCEDTSAAPVLSAVPLNQNLLFTVGLDLSQPSSYDCLYLGTSEAAPVYYINVIGNDTANHYKHVLVLNCLKPDQMGELLIYFWAHYYGDASHTLQLEWKDPNGTLHSTAYSVIEGNYDENGFPVLTSEILQ